MSPRMRRHIVFSPSGRRPGIPTIIRNRATRIYRGGRSSACVISLPTNISSARARLFGRPSKPGSPNWPPSAEPSLRVSAGTNPRKGRPFRRCGGRRNSDSITAGKSGLEPNRASIGGRCRRLFAARRSPVISDDCDFSLSACLKSLRHQSSAATNRFQIRHRPFSLTAGNASSCPYADLPRDME